jgi:hypothetical protein
MTKIGELGTTQAATSNRRTLRALSRSSEKLMNFAASFARRHLPEDIIHYSHCCKNPNSVLKFGSV